ncbi:CoA pyrophosphatase [Gemmatimonas sp.]|uniref:NUDIX hydrolase n=1 Tax=Gemmatimonas sp. TaxID=1962908 RepID=UPI00356931B2
MQLALQHADVSRLARRLASRVPVDASPAAESRLAAVSAVLRVVDGAPELLFIKRAELERDPWSGHMAFPGGRLEPGDASLEVTAVRETQEELALDLTQGRMLGRLDDLAPHNRSLPPIIIRPFVAIVEPDVMFMPSEEVAATFWVPLARLQHESSRARYEVEMNGIRASFPAFRVEQHIVWGLTERIVRQLLALVSP